MKFFMLFALLCAAFCSDGAATVEKKIGNRESLDVTSSLSALIGQIIASVQASLHEMTVQTESLIQSALSEIDNTVRNLEAAVSVYIQEVKDQIDKLVNEEILPCLEGVLGEVDNVLTEATAGIRNCQEIATGKLTAIREDVESFKKVNQAAFEGALAFVHECSTLSNFGDKVKCIVDASRNMSSAVAVFRENLSHFISVVEARVGEVVAETKECVNNEVVLAQKAVSDTLVDAEKCLEGKREYKTELKAKIASSEAQSLEQKIS